MSPHIFLLTAHLMVWYKTNSNYIEIYLGRLAIIIVTLDNSKKHIGHG
jgi:hypothetical protein